VAQAYRRAPGAVIRRIPPRPGSTSSAAR